jgi:hypothetical protein
MIGVAARTVSSLFLLFAYLSIAVCRELSQTCVPEGTRFEYQTGRCLYELILKVNTESDRPSLAFLVLSSWFLCFIPSFDTVHT